MNDLKILTKISILYYRDGLTHKQIADRLGLSRQKVGRFIERSKQEGVVNIQIKSPLLFATELETCLEKAFNLKEALVVSPAAEGEDAIKEALGMAGAEFLERHISSGDTLGISWGSTVLEVGRRVKICETQEYHHCSAKWKHGCGEVFYKSGIYRRPGC